MGNKFKLALMLGVGVSLAFGFAGTASAQKKGGILNFVVGSKIPSYDGHRESTFGMIHPIRPFYSTLIRVNPNNPQSPTDFQCDLCVGKVPAGTDGGLKYTFKIRKGVEFHDGQKLTAHDVVATFKKIISPPKGIPSNRKAFFGMVESVTAPDDTTMVFKLKYATGGFLPAVALPFNFVYSKKDLETKGYNWHTKNINGTGAFRFVQHQPGAFVEGKRFAKYHHAGKPYLDGYKAISAPKMAVRVQAIRGNRAAIEFRGFPPKTRDDLVKALGNKITVQESNWNCLMGSSPNQKKDKFKDPRVRKALSLAFDRWGGSKYLSQIAIVKTVGGIVFPGHPMAATEAELKSMDIFNPDNKMRRAMAKKLLAAAGKSGMDFVLWNRAVDQPYKIVGTWMIDQWKQIGLNVKQAVVPSGPWYAGLRKRKDFDVSIDFNCQSVVNPVVDSAKFISADKTGNNYTSVIDRTLDKMYDEMNREPDQKKVRKMLRKYERRILDEQANFLIAYWWYKINPHRSYVKGWKIAPSHYLNQHLDQVWLDK
jgi:peptide/nickel transport system substrate-binding protein